MHLIARLSWSANGWTAPTSADDLASSIHGYVVEYETGKTGTREVTISPATAELLKRRRNGAPDDRYVLGVHAGTVRTSLSQRYLPAACRAAGLPTFMPHGLRRLTVNELYDNGIDPTVAASMLGHAPQTAARYYRRASIEKKRSAATAAGHLGFASNVVAFAPPPIKSGPSEVVPTVSYEPVTGGV